MLPATTFVAVLAAGVSGLAFGFGYFAMLRKSISVYSSGGKPGRPAVLMLVRLTTAGVFFGLVAHFGALLLLAAFIGFLVARTVALSAARRAT